MTRAGWIWAFGSVLALLASPAVAAAREGYLVFSPTGAASYTRLSDALPFERVADKMFLRLDDVLIARNRIYVLDQHNRKVVRYNSVFKSESETRLDIGRDVPFWLGEGKDGLLLLAGNKVLYLSLFLREVRRLDLTPQAKGERAPVVTPVRFLIYGGTGYLLADTGEVFVVPLTPGLPNQKVAATFSIDAGGAPLALWLAPIEGTLSVLGRYRVDQPNFRGVRDIVSTFLLSRPDEPPRRTMLYEQNTGLEAAQGKGLGQGLRLAAISTTTPAVADVFLEDQQRGILSPRYTVRLRGFGGYDLMAVSTDGAGRSVAVDGVRRYLEDDGERRVLRLQPATYARLRTQAGLADGVLQTLPLDAR
jgi:hypothetical protein